MDIEPRMQQLMGDLSDDSTPAVVWFYAPDDEEALKAVDGKIFQNEKVGIALKKFRCLRVNVTAIQSAELREKYTKMSPVFMFFDPSGEKTCEISGKRAESLRNFRHLLERTWNMSFTVRLDSFTKQMTRILDRLDRLDQTRQALERDRARLAERPNPAKQRKLAREEDEFQEDMAKLVEDDTELKQSVELRPEYRSTEQAALSR